MPHFEKMLYDNALLARAYALACRVTGAAAAQRASPQETLDYLLREMRLPRRRLRGRRRTPTRRGGEGAFFVWTPQELRRAADAAAGPRGDRSATGSPRRATSRAASILHVSGRSTQVSQQLGEDAGPLLVAARAALYGPGSSGPRRRATTSSSPPGTGWRSPRFADAGVILGRGDYVDAAIATAAPCSTRWWSTAGCGGCRPAARPSHLGQLDDHADLCHGLLRLYEATFHPRWLAAARGLADRMVELFADPDGDGFFFAGADGERLVARTREVEDHPTPAGNSQAAHVLLRLADLTGDAELEERAPGGR